MKKALKMVVSIGIAMLLLGSICAPLQAASVRLKDIGRFESEREAQLIGYGMVMGLAGTGDSARNRATRQSIANLLSRFDVQIPPEQIQSRNVAVVMVTASMSGSVRMGDRLDVTISSLGDAKSLVGGTLLLTALKTTDGEIRAVAQGPLSVGGYRYDANGNVVQKNHPTAALIPGGASIERLLDDGRGNMGSEGSRNLVYVLRQADLATAHRIAAAINAAMPSAQAFVKSASTVEISLRDGQAVGQAGGMAQRIELLQVEPDVPARVVVNERTGTVVAGGDVRISPITISHGDLRISVVTDPIVSQPGYGEFISPGIRTAVVQQSRIDVDEAASGGVVQAQNTVTDLVKALNRIKVSPRDMISILQGVKAAGALHAEIIIQ